MSEKNIGDSTQALDSVGFVLTKADGTVEEIQPQNKVKKDAASALLALLSLLKKRQDQP